MEKMLYWDFDLLLERSGNDYVARAIESPASQASIQFTVSLTGARFERFFASIDRSKTPRPSDSALSAATKSLGEYHLFHFVSHGQFDQHAQNGSLLFEDKAGLGQVISGDYLGTLLHHHQSLRLCILNACEGARSSRDDPFSGTAQTLVRQDIPAVITMQF